MVRAVPPLARVQRRRWWRRRGRVGVEHDGREQRHHARRPIDTITSVASFFVNRVDDKVPDFKTAIANATLAYQAFEELFATPR